VNKYLHTVASVGFLFTYTTVLSEINNSTSDFIKKRKGEFLLYPETYIRRDRKLFMSPCIW